MFRDKDTFKARFFESNILAPNAELLAVSGLIDVIYITNVLHLWTWDTQALAMKTLVALSKPGTMVVGLQVGDTEGGVCESLQFDY
jgi:hypothetical protein